MLKVTIVKNYHGSQKDAKLLIPYIQRSDVFSYEQAFLPQSEAKRTDYFGKMLCIVI